MHRRGIIELSDEEREFLCSCIIMAAKDGFYGLPDNISIDDINLASLVCLLDPNAYEKWIKEDLK